MKIVVTGSAGFIGSHLVDEYIKNGFEVLIIDNLSTGKEKNINKNALFEKVDLKERGKLSKIIEALFAHYQISAAGFDVVFAEKDTSSGLQSLEKLADSTLKNNADFQTSWLGLRQKLDFDRHFAQAMQERSVVLGYYFNNDKNRQSGLLPAPALEPWMLEGEPPKNIQKWIGFGANIPLLQQSAASAKSIT